MTQAAVTAPSSGDYGLPLLCLLRLGLRTTCSPPWSSWGGMGVWRVDGCLAPVAAVDHALLKHLAETIGSEPPVSRVVEASSMAFGHGCGRSVSIGISAGSPLNILAWAIKLLIEDDLSACAVGPAALLTGDQRLGASWPTWKPTSRHLQRSLAPWKWLFVRAILHRLEAITVRHN